MRESFIIPNRDFCQLNLRLLNQRHNNVRLHFVSYVELSKGQRLKCGVCWSRKIRNGWKELMTGGAKSRYWTCRKKITEEGKENPHNSQSNFPFKCCNRTRLLWKDVTLEEEKKTTGQLFLNAHKWPFKQPTLTINLSNLLTSVFAVGKEPRTDDFFHYWWRSVHKKLPQASCVSSRSGFFTREWSLGTAAPPKEQQTEKVIGQIENIKPVN